MKKDPMAARRRYAVTLAPRVLLGLIFLLSGTGKLPGQAEFADYLLESFWGPTTAFLISRLVPWLELVLGILFLLRLFPRFASVLALPLILGFIINNSWAISQGINEFPECAYCFGFFEEFFGAISPVQSLVLDIVLLAAALVVLVFHPGGFFKWDPWMVKSRR